MQTTQTITINVTERCVPVSLFTNTNFPSPLTYTLGEAGGDIYSFLFEYTTSPASCDTFPITYTLSGGPDMLTVNDTLEQLEVAQSFDLTQRGTYSSVQLLATLTDPADGSTIQATGVFPVQVFPCQLSSFTASPDDLGTVTYTIGDAGFYFGDYIYSQVNACNYPETESLVGSIPDSSFFTYLKDENRFQVTQTQDITVAGTYVMKIKAIISVPLDANTSPLI